MTKGIQPRPSSITNALSGVLLLFVPPSVTSVSQLRKNVQSITWTHVMQGQAVRWIKGWQADRGLLTLDADAPDRLRQLGNAVKFGVPVLLQVQRRHIIQLQFKILIVLDTNAFYRLCGPWALTVLKGHTVGNMHQYFIHATDKPIAITSAATSILALVTNVTSLLTCH
jgi:hypothetical protein